MKANTSIEPDENDSVTRRVVVKPKKVVSTSLNKQRGINKKHVKTAKTQNKLENSIKEGQMIVH